MKVVGGAFTLLPAALLYAKAATCSVWVRVLLPRLGLVSLCENLGITLGLDRGEPKPPLRLHEDQELLMTVRATRRVSRILGRNCLVESLVAGYLLRVRRPILRIGWWKDRHATFGHAWLELDGRPVPGLSGSSNGWQDKIAVLGRFQG